MKDDALTVADIMHTEVRTVGRNDTLSGADDVMKQGRIRHLPVLDQDGKLCGIVSQRDLFRGMLLRALGYGTYLEQKMLEGHRVKEAMVEPVYTITPEATLKQAAELMLEHKIGCLPVIDNGTLSGIVTETDFVSQFTRA